jgi:hypothetical protein
MRAEILVRFGDDKALLAVSEMQDFREAIEWGPPGKLESDAATDASLGQPRELANEALRKRLRKIFGTKLERSARCRVHPCDSIPRAIPNEGCAR